MNIRTIHLQNFRSYESAKAKKLGRLNLFAGGNGAGKSTILDAIAFALTGTCRGADSGRALKDLRRVGSKRRFEVRLDIDSPGEGEGWHQIGRSESEGPKSKAQEHVEGTLGVGDQIRACLYSGELLRLKPAEAQKLILDLAQPAEVEIDADLGELIAKHVGGGVPGSLGLPAIEAAHEKAYAKRREVNRELSAMGEPVEPTPPDGAEDLEGRTVADLDALREKVEQRLRVLRGERESTEDLMRATERGPAEAQRELADLEEQLAKAREALPDPKAIATEMSALAKTLGQADKVEREIAEKRASLAGAIGRHEGEIETATRYFREVSAGKTECMVCGTKLTPAKKKKAEERFRARKETAERDQAKARDELQVVNETDKDRVQIQREARGKLESLESQERRYEELKARVGKLEKEIEGARQRAEAAAPQADVVALREEIEKADRSIGAGQEKLQVLATYRAQLVGLASHEKRRATLEREHRELDDLVKALGADGIRKDVAAGEGVEQFTSTIESLMDELGMKGTSLGPLLRKEGPPTVGGVQVAEGHLSRSQLARFGVCFQVAVATATKLGVVAVDDVDQYEPQVVRELQRLLVESGHQVFMFQVLKDRDAFIESARQVNGKGGVRLYLVERNRGVSTIVRPDAAEEAA